ncbi:MAG: non-ribosomal peptide synthetase [Candidatus Binatia bacterium]
MFVHEVFEAQVRKTPDNVAVRFEGRSLAYGELNSRANQLAHYLRTLGVGPEKVVGVCLDRSDDLVIAVLAILKAGGACLPLDPSYPADRLAFMLEDSSIPVLLSQKRYEPNLRELRGLAAQTHDLESPVSRPGCKVVFLDSGRQAIDRERTENLDNQVTSENLAFVFYTSGSTGKPKAVMWGHSKRDSLQTWQEKTYELTEQDRHLLKTPVGFTLLSKEVFLPLLTGAQMLIVPAGLERDPAFLVKLIARHGITIVTLVPSMLRMILEEADLEQCLALRHVCTFGEPLTPWLQQRFFSRLPAQLSVIYGATEAPSAAFVRCNREDPEPALVLGNPLPQKEIYLVNDRLEAVPPGMRGEICIGGKLARGYLNRPDLTAEKFVPHPFYQEPGARLYRTGDVGRSLPSGSIEFLGRADDQIKIRGFRIEPVEVESVLRQHPTVREAIVVGREDTSAEAGVAENQKSKTENLKSAKRLVAYVVSKDDSRPAIRELLSLLKQELPDYMIPSAFVFLDALPLSPNGKIDRNALPSPGNTRPDVGVPFVAPRTPLEEELTEIWKEVLSLDSVGIDDNFLDLGGHSLLASQIISQVIKRFQLDLPVQLLFDSPTVAQMAVVIANSEAAKFDEDELERVLAELESVSESEARQIVTGTPPLKLKTDG